MTGEVHCLPNLLRIEETVERHPDIDRVVFSLGTVDIFCLADALTQLVSDPEIIPIKEAHPLLSSLIQEARVMWNAPSLTRDEFFTRYCHPAVAA